LKGFCTGGNELPRHYCQDSETGMCEGVFHICSNY
jgi:hypothetical protein